MCYKTKCILTLLRGDCGYYSLISIILIPSYPVLRAMLLRIDRGLGKYLIWQGNVDI